MKRRRFSKLATAALISTAVLSAGFMDSVVSEASHMVTGSSSSQSTDNLSDTLTKSLGINPTQALGGTAALMSLASSTMPNNKYTELLKSVPGLSSTLGNSAVSSALSLAGGNNSVESSFKSLGMNKETLYKFAPALLSYISKYATPDNLSYLKKAWGEYLK